MAQEYVWIFALVVSALLTRYGLSIYKGIEVAKAEIDKEFKLQRAKLYASRDVNVAKIEAGAEIELNSIGNNPVDQTGDSNMDSIMGLLSNPQFKPIIDKFLAKKE